MAPAASPAPATSGLAAAEREHDLAALKAVTGTPPSPPLRATP